MFLSKFGVLRAVMMKFSSSGISHHVKLIIVILQELLASTLESVHTKKTHLSNTNYLPIDIASYPMRMKIFQSVSCW